MVTRRTVLKAGVVGGVGLALPLRLSGGAVTAQGQGQGTPPPPVYLRRPVTPADRRKAAENAAAAGLEPGVAAATMDIAGVPHYFGPYPNYANSPLPTGAVTSIVLEDGGSGYSAGAQAIIGDVYGTGSGATATVDGVDANGAITGITLGPGGSGYSAPVVSIEDVAGGTGTGAVASAAIGGTLSGGIKKFIDAMPGLGAANANGLGQYIPVAVPDTTSYPAGGIGYTSTPTVTITDASGSGAAATATVAGGVVTGFAVTSGGANYSTHPVVTVTGGGASVQTAAVATVANGAITAIATVAADYYEIELGQYSEKLHTNLPPTLLRGYRQTNTTDPAISEFHYLGPLIVAKRNVPVRIKFTNNLPTGMDGDLFIPVDTTVMGAGMGPLGMDAMPMNYAQNRATLHLHGGFVPWISDGTPHQWTTPAGEMTSYPKGVSAYGVPDMPGAGDTLPAGVLTFYYNNQQSARLMFYHDHAYGITRLNVYAGEAAGYLVTDEVEQDLIGGTNVSGVNPGLQQLLPDAGIPLIIQDKTFVDAATIVAQDPMWRWGATPGTPNTGDLWLPSVYMPAQNPWDLSGASAFGRWHYGPWFWPPTTNITHPPVPNEYYQPDPNQPDYAPWEPPFRPDTPLPSMGMEAFMDTMLVNGTAYPYLEVEPKAYRFRILNAANDRFLNLQMYVADPAVVTSDLRINTEVKMVPAIATAGFPALWPKDNREGGVPDAGPLSMGPSWVQIGTEGGFLPAPVVIPNQPITWEANPTLFNVGNVKDHSLLLGNAERADVIVDFSAYAGKTIILYNDAPAAFPALDPRYDYYTGNPDQTGEGGTPPTQAGYGPNIRTVMQFRVGNAVATPFALDLPGLQAAFAKTTGKRGVFEASQDTIILPQAAYNSAYGLQFPTRTEYQYALQMETFKTFTPIGAGTPVTIAYQPKAIQDEMGEAYDTEYGRMSGMLGLERSPAVAGGQNFMIYGYGSPPVDVIRDSIAPIGVLGDGTEIWHITHNGVDTHPIHFHLFNVQLLNRVAWDGQMLVPDANELGWKETVRVNPLQHTFVALRPVAPVQPFELPNSVRAIDPTMAIGAVLPGPPGGFKDPRANPVPVVNHVVNYGAEYVWHCHILSHEEMDMMHSLVFGVAPRSPINLTYTVLQGSQGIRLSWVDDSITETSFLVQRAKAAAGPWTTLVTLPGVADKGSTLTYTDSAFRSNQVPYWYRVIATNVVGDTTVYPAPAVGFPTKAIDSMPITVGPPAGVPTSVTAMPGATRNSGVVVSWTYSPGGDNTGFLIQRATAGDFGAGLTTITVLGATTTTYADRQARRGTQYWYRVAANNPLGVGTYAPAAAPVVAAVVDPGDEGGTSEVYIPLVQTPGE